MYLHIFRERDRICISPFYPLSVGQPIVHCAPARHAATSFSNQQRGSRWLQAGKHHKKRGNLMESMDNLWIIYG